MSFSRSRLKRTLFALFPAAVILLLLGGAEYALRRWSPAPEWSLTSEATYDGIRWYEVNRSYLKKYFPANTPVVPEFKPTLFRQQKGAKTFRIFCLGESTMFGTPYEMTANIPGLVRKQLRHLYPEKEIEVVNLGASAINSNVIRDLVSLIPSYEPDLVLLYAGHNEFYGPDGIGASLPEQWLPALTRFKYKLRELRLVQLIQSWLMRQSRRGAGEDAANLMRQVSEGSRVRLHSTDADRVFRNFESNLSEIAQELHKRRIPLIVSDVASNLLFPPFISDSVASSGGGGSELDAAIACFHAGRPEEARVRLSHLLTRDSLNASLNYWLGRVLCAEGRGGIGKEYLVRARDNDLLKFRAPGEIDTIIRRVCAQTSTPLISSDSLLSALSPDGIAGDAMFWEHLHPTLRGYYEIANNFVRSILDLHLLGEPARTTAPTLIPFQTDSLSVCWLDLAYADLSIQHLTSRWPFQDYHRVPAVVDTSEEALMQVARETYARRLRWDEGCYKTASYFWSTGKFQPAKTTYEALLEEYPYNFYPQYLLGSLLNHAGNPRQAILCYERSIASNPAYPQSRLDLGLIRINSGEPDKGIHELRAVLDLLGPQGSPELRARALYGLAAAFANKGQFPDALTNIELSLRLAPRSADAQQLRAQILAAQGR